MHQRLQPLWFHREKTRPTRRARFYHPELIELEARVLPSIVNMPLTTNPSVQQQPSIAVDPHNSKHVVVAFMDYSLVNTGYAGIGTMTSFDGGQIWSAKSVIPVPAAFDQGAANPIVEFDNQGHVFVSFMAVTFTGALEAPQTNPGFYDRGVPGTESNNGIFVCRSDDGGMTWNTAATVVSHQYNGTTPVSFECIPDLAIDTFPTQPNGQPNPNYGNMYEVWTRVYPAGVFPGQPTAPGGTDIMIAVSKDDGMTWVIQLENPSTLPSTFAESTATNPVTTIQDPINGSSPLGLGGVDQANVTVGPDGDIYVSSYGGGDFSVYHSTDDGASFAYPTHSNTEYLAFGNSGNAFVNITGLGNGDLFRTFTVRDLVADPSRPGYVYAATTELISDAAGNIIDPANVLFARSTDYGVTWTTTFTVGTTVSSVLDDDNGGQSPTGLSTDVISAQAMPRLSVDAQGDISLIWYDTRNDPAGHDLDVYGTTSTDGGLTFSPNFRVTTQSFDPNLGVFSNPTTQPGGPIVASGATSNTNYTNASGQPNYYIGDYIGLALANNTAYAAWTDTLAGNQDICFASYPLSPAPAPPSDRYQPNNTPAEATVLGKAYVGITLQINPIIEKTVPRLELPAANEEWYSVQAAATGTFTVTASSDDDVALAPNALLVQLWDGTGTTQLGAGTDLEDAASDLIGQTVAYPSNAGHSFLVEVFRTNTASTNAFLYTLSLQCLTADLGAQVVTDVTGTIAVGAQALYRLTAPAAGSLEVQFSNGANVSGNLNVQILDADTLGVLSKPPSPVSVPVSGPNYSIGEATDTGLVGPGSVLLADTIGMGPFAQTSGDYNFYKLVADANEKITVDEIPGAGGALDGVIVLYDSAGTLLDLVDNNGPSTPESLTYETTTADTYYVVIYASTSTDAPPTNPFVPGSPGGGKPPTAGPYSATITVQDIGPGAIEQASIPVQQGQTVLLLVSGEGQSTGNYDLDVVNLDQFDTPDNASPHFPAGAGPSQMAVGDLTGDGFQDIVVANTLSNTVSVLLNNGDGTFQAPRQYVIGSFKAPSGLTSAYTLVDFRRSIALADLAGDGKLDIVVTNLDSGDVSVLLNRGDGTFEPQRVFDATSAPIGLAVGDLTGNGIPDIVAIDSQAGTEDATVAVLLGRGDGTFLPEQTFAAGIGGYFPLSTVALADLTGNGKLDLVISGNNAYSVSVFLGNGNGTFQTAQTYPAGRLGAGIAVADLTGDGKLDLVNTAVDPGGVAYLTGNGDGTFSPNINPTNSLPIFPAGQSPVAVAVAYLPTGVVNPNGSITETPGKHPDLIIAASGADTASTAGPPGIYVVPTLWGPLGNFVGLGLPLLLPVSVEQPLDVKVADLNRNGGLEVIVLDENGVRVIPNVVLLDVNGLQAVVGQQSNIVANNTPQTSRNLGTVVHVLEPTLTIVPGHEDAYYTFTAPTEAITQNNEVLDFSADFQALAGAGLGMQVLDAAANVLASGDRFRISVAQGATLTLHIFGLQGANGQRGAGAYTLDVVTLPQVVSVEAQALLPGAGALPGGPTASLVITFQGERLDPETAQMPANYTVTWLGPNGLPGAADNQVIPVESAVYDPSTNVDVANGLNYPTAVRQTLTLLFDQPLPAGSYQIELARAIQALAFNEDEAQVLTQAPGFTGHPVVSLVKAAVQPGYPTVAAAQTVIAEGSNTLQAGLIQAVGPLGDFSVWAATGTPFFTQLHDDLGALLDLSLTELGGGSSLISAIIDSEILERFNPALGPANQRSTGVLIIWADPPVNLNLLDPQSRAVNYSQSTNTLSNQIPNANVIVYGNIDVVVIPTNGGNFYLNLAGLGGQSRFGAVYLGPSANFVYQLTAKAQNAMSTQNYLLPLPLSSTSLDPGPGTSTGTNAVPATGSSSATQNPTQPLAATLAGGEAATGSSPGATAPSATGATGATPPASTGPTNKVWLPGEPPWPPALQELLAAMYEAMWQAFQAMGAGFFFGVPDPEPENPPDVPNPLDLVLAGALQESPGTLKPGSEDLELMPDMSNGPAAPYDNGAQDQVSAQWWEVPGLLDPAPAPYIGTVAKRKAGSYVEEMPKPPADERCKPGVYPLVIGALFAAAGAERRRNLECHAIKDDLP